MKDLTASAKQAEITIRAMLAYYDAPEPGRVLMNRPDRVIFEATDADIEWLRYARRPNDLGQLAFRKRTAGISRHNWLEGYEAIDGFQETRGRIIGRFVMQAVIMSHVWDRIVGTVARERRKAVDWDIDGFGVGNPIETVCHMAMWAWQRVPLIGGGSRRMTDQEDARRYLVRKLGIEIPAVGAGASAEGSAV